MLMTTSTPVILSQRTLSATTNTERGKTSVKRVGEYFVQICQNDYQSLNIQFICLKVNACLAFQQNPDFKWYQGRYM